MNGCKDTLLQIKNETAERLAADRRSLKKLPEGSLGRNKTPNGKYHYIKITDQKGQLKRTGITNNKDMIYALARKKFLLRSIKTDASRICAVEKALKVMPEDDAEYDFSKMVTASSLPNRAFLFVDDPQNWLQVKQSEDTGEYAVNNIHPTNAGVMMKSKDEVRIGNIFEAEGIVYIYEKAMDMYYFDSKKGCRVHKVFHPDFMIYQEHSDPIIWEHCGVMDDPKYFDRLMSRIQIYYENGFTLWNNLVLSFDNRNGSFNERKIRQQIQMHLQR